MNNRGHKLLTLRMALYLFCIDKSNLKRVKRKFKNYKNVDFVILKLMLICISKTKIKVKKVDFLFTQYSMTHNIHKIKYKNLVYHGIAPIHKHKVLYYKVKLEFNLKFIKNI